MCQVLVCVDWGGLYFVGFDVVDGFVECELVYVYCVSCIYDVFGVQVCEKLCDCCVFGFNQCIGGQLDVVEENLELVFGVDQFYFDWGVVEFGSVGGYYE